MFQLPITA